MIAQNPRKVYRDPRPIAAETAAPYHLDLHTMPVPMLMREEFALRRQFGGRRHPGREVAERLAAVEVALMREDAR